jgi:hypothetical protein
MLYKKLGRMCKDKTPPIPHFGECVVVPHLVKPYEESCLLLLISYLIFFSSNVTFQTYFENIHDRLHKI